LKSLDSAQRNVYLVLTHISGVMLPDGLDEEPRLQRYDVLHPGTPSFKTTEKITQAPISFPLIDNTSVHVEIDVHHVIHERHVECSSLHLRSRMNGELSGTAWVEVQIDAQSHTFGDDDPTDPAHRVINRAFTHAFEGLEESTEYEFQVCGTNQLGIGPWSQSIVCTTAASPRDLGVVGPVELLTERFRPPEAHFQMINKLKTGDAAFGSDFETANQKQDVPVFCCPPEDPDSASNGARLEPAVEPAPMPAMLKRSATSIMNVAVGADGWSHSGHFSSACMSSTLAEMAGISPFGADNVLKNRAYFIRKAGTPPTQPVPEDYRPRDGAASTWVSVSVPRNENFAKKGRASSTEHVIKHEMVTAHLSLEAATSIGDESGTTHAQSVTSFEDPYPALLLTLPVGCLIEEVLLVDGYPPCKESRITQLLVEVFHLDQMQLRERESFGNLETVLNTLTPVFRGEATPTGTHAACINLKQWAENESLTAAQKAGRRIQDVGAVYFDGGAHGKARLPDSEGAVFASGVIGNVIRVRWKPQPNGQPFVNNPPGGEHIRFAVGGLVLVGRRIHEPLWRDIAWFKQRVAEQMKTTRSTKKLGMSAFMKVAEQVIDKPDLQRAPTAASFPAQVT